MPGQLLPTPDNVKPRQGVDEGEHQHRKKVGRVNAKKTADKKTAPFPALLLITHMDAKPADDEENGDPGFTEIPQQDRNLAE